MSPRSTVSLRLAALVLAGLAAASCGDIGLDTVYRPAGSGQLPTSDAGGADSSPSTETEIPAQGILLDELEINQAVAITIASSSTPLDVQSRALPVLQGRSALLRAFWQRDPSFQSRIIEARLTLEYPDASSAVLSDSRYIDADPDRSRIDGSFRWLLRGDQIRADTRYSVELFEVEPPSQPETPLATRIPANGTDALGVSTKSLTFKLKVLPINTLDGHPSTLEGNRSLIQDFAFDLLPVGEITIDTGPLISTSGVRDDWLINVCNARDNAHEPDDVYYLGIADLAGLAGDQRQGMFNATRHCAVTAMAVNSTYDGYDAESVVQMLWALLGVTQDAHAACPIVDRQGYSVSRQLLRGPMGFADPLCDLRTAPAWASLQSFSAVLSALESQTP